MERMDEKPENRIPLSTEAWIKRYTMMLTMVEGSQMTLMITMINYGLFIVITFGNAMFLNVLCEEKL